MDLATPLQNPDDDGGDYSAATTTVQFPNPLPLLRGPLPAGRPDDPSYGPYVLAFRNPQSWAAAYKSSESKIIEQCEAGARIGCAIAASDKCKPPWWRNLIGGAPKLADLKERERCEEREMEGCLADAKEKCVGFGKDKCFRPFADARIAIGEKAVASKLVSLASMLEGSCNGKYTGLIGFDECGIGATNFRASQLLGDKAKYHWFFKPSVALSLNEFWFGIIAHGPSTLGKSLSAAASPSVPERHDRALLQRCITRNL